MSNFKNNLRYVRRKLSISQEEVAIHVGVRSTTISNWENGVSEPDVEQFVLLTQYFGFSADVFLFENFGSGNFVTEDYVKHFGKRSKPGVRSLSKNLKYQESGDKISVVNEEEQNFLWIVLQTLRQMDVKIADVKQELTALKERSTG